MTEVPDETTSSWNAEMLCNRDRIEEVVPADNESFKALDISQTIPTGTEEVIHPDSHNTDGQVANVKLLDGVLDIVGSGTISVVLKCEAHRKFLFFFSFLLSHSLFGVSNLYCLVTVSIY